MYYCGRVREHYTPDKAMWYTEIPTLLYLEYYVLLLDHNSTYLSSDCTQKSPHCFIWSIMFSNVGISVYSQGSGMYYCGRVREHYTPDKAMWGFLCTVRAQVCTIVVE
jgi:hypothetical protein